MKKCNKRIKAVKPKQVHIFSKNEIKLIKACQLIRKVYVSRLKDRYNQKNRDIRTVIQIISKQLIGLKAAFINQLGGYKGPELLSALNVISDFHQKKKLRSLAKKAARSVRAIKYGVSVMYVSCG
jgi:hypothetical protein